MSVPTIQETIESSQAFGKSLGLTQAQTVVWATYNKEFGPNEEIYNFVKRVCERLFQESVSA